MGLFRTFRSSNLALLLLCLGLGCSSDVPAPQQSPRQPQKTPSRELVVVSTNDFHAALDRAEGLASVIRGLRKRYGDRMIYLDAGDQFQGSLEGNIEKGRAVVEFFNLLHLDAAALGNHEFDYGPNVLSRVTVRQGEDGMGNLKERVREANFPMLSANLIVSPPVSCEPGPDCNALGHKTIFLPRAVFQRAGSKVCVIGTTTPLTKNITSPLFLQGTEFQDVKSVVQAEASRFRKQEGCDWILLLAHEGLRYETDGKTFKNSGLLPLLQSLPAGTVDAVIGGHSHTPLQTVINKTPVMQTGKGGRNVGVLHLIRNGGASHRFEPMMAVPDTGVAPDVTSSLMFYRKEAFEYKRRIIGASTAPFFPGAGETALGNLVADSLRHAKEIKSDLALINGGAIRSYLPRKISIEDVFRVMPFDDALVVVDITRSELQSLLEIACSGALHPCSVSGLQIKTISSRFGERDLNGDGKREDWERNLIDAVADSNGRPLADRTYRLATTSYLVEGGDYQGFVYDRIPPSRIHYYGELLIRDLLAEYIKEHSPLNPGAYYSRLHPRIEVLPIE